MLVRGGTPGDGAGEEGGNSEVHGIVLAVVREYLAVAAGGGLTLADFSPATPLMEAGLDSLDLLKVSSSRWLVEARWCCDKT